MDAVSDHAVERVVIMSSAQVGKTEIVNNIVGYHIDQDPAPILVLQPTLQMGEAWSKDRLAPMLRDSPCLKGKVKDARSRDSGNTLLHKTFPGGHITIAGANSPASLASRPIRIVLADEVDRYPVSAGTEGDPLTLAQKRSTTFWNRKLIETSTPTVEGASRIALSFERSDKRYYFVPCGTCGEFQTLKWASVKWPENEPDAAYYECECCGAKWDDSERWKAIRSGEWRATAPFNGTAGFHIWEAYSSWVKLREIVKAFYAARTGGPEMLKAWTNTALGETWREKGDAPDWRRLYERREHYNPGTAPRSVLFLTAGADVQQDRIEVQVVGWGRNKQSWLVDYIVLQGDTARGEVWGQLTQILGTMYLHESGQHLQIQRLCVDSGFATQAVYNWARLQNSAVVSVIKGSSDAATQIVGQPTALDVVQAGNRIIRRGIKVYPVNVSALKSEFYGWLRQDRPTDEELNAGIEFPHGFFHFYEQSEEYFRQLTAEQLVTRLHKGFGKQEWEKVRERNEALDTWVYARAASYMVGMDRNQRQPAWWDALEAQFMTENAPKHKTRNPERPESSDAPARRGESWFKSDRRSGSWFGR